MRPLGIMKLTVILSIILVISGCKEATRDEKEFNDAKRYADTGSYLGQIMLGEHYQKGHGTEADTNKAIGCYFRALELIQAEKEKFPTTLEGWKQLAAKEPHERKIDYLLGLYFEGMFRSNNGEIKMEAVTETIAVDQNEARKWYEKAIKGDWSGENLNAYMQLVELSNSAKSERDYLETASAKGSAEAKYELSKKLIYEKDDEIVYENGRRFHMISDSKDYKFTQDTSRLFSGLNLMKKSSELGCSVASGHLYEIYSNWRLNSPLGKDEKLAWLYRRKQDEQLLSQSYCRLWFLSWQQEPSLASLLPYSKEGIETILRHRMRALRGDPESIFALSVCHYYGQGVTKDPEEALHLCKESASLGYPLALLSMGNRYFDGSDVIKDEIEAYAYWNLAGVNLKEGGEYIAEVEKKLTESARLLGQRRSRELQAEIEAKKSKVSRK